MLSPEYLRELPERILKLYDSAERRILADMARRIAAYDFWIPAVDWQNQILLETGRAQDDILTALHSLTGRTQAELKKLMRDAGGETLRSDAAVYERAGENVPPVSASEPLKVILNSGYRATAQEMRNLCRTTARTTAQRFERVLDSAWLEVQSGAFSTDAAIRQAIQELSERGLSAIRYASGREDSLEVAVRRAVVTGVNQTCGQLQEELADELECDLVEVSAHEGARPEHAAWQGKIFSRSGKDPKYPPFRQSTGYGTGAGLCGWNCRHTFGPYIEGAPAVWDEAALAELDKPQYNYNGTRLTEYEAQQLQRKNEREIRRWKREYAMMDAAGLDTSEAAAKLRSAQEHQKDFLQKTGLKRQHEREEKTGFGWELERKANVQGRNIETHANSIFNYGSTEENVKAYLKEKSVIDTLARHGVKYKQRISTTEIVVDAGRPTISGMTKHAMDNLINKSDRADMTIEQAQIFVDRAKLTLFQVGSNSLKFLAEEGYAALNFESILITAVPQKWRKKYDKYIGVQ